MRKYSLQQDFRNLFVVIALLLFTQACLAQIISNANGVVYVNKSVSGGDNSGNSWANAVPELADALLAAYYDTSIHQIWVAKGTYSPEYSAGTDGMAPNSYFGSPDGGIRSFLLVKNVQLYGGFQNANETAISQRDTLNSNTILDGLWGLHVVMSVGDVGTAEINGFTITKGSGHPYQNFYINSMTTYSARGGGIYVESSAPTISNCVITDNYAEWGAGIYANNSSLIISNTIINDNHATGGSGNATNSIALSFGGGIYVRDGITVSINNCNISNNTVSAARSGVWGGGICIVGYTCTTTITNSTISGNTISAVITGNSNEGGNATGGGLYLVTASATIDNCTISNNSATVSSVDATATSINYNYAEGGGILNGSPLIISNSIISDNHISATVNPANNSLGWCSGAGIMNDGGLIPGTGGGMVTGSNSVINNCIIENNSAAGNFDPSGGGIAYNTPFLLLTPVIPKINNSIIRNNTAGQYGGAIHCFALSPLIKNTLIANNTAADGGAIYNMGFSQASKPLLVNCTVYGNTATGANANIITNNDSCITSMYNSVLYGNSGNITNSGTTVTYSIVQGNAVYPGTGNSNADPLFNDATNGDFALQTNSPAINAGNNAAYSLAGDINVDTDLAGNPRVYGNIIDMGAFESPKRGEDTTTGIAAVNAVNAKMKVYPNPVNAGHTITIRCDYAPAMLRSAQLAVADISGRILQVYASVRPAQTLVLPATGTYFVTLTLQSGEKVSVPVAVE